MPALFVFLFKVNIALLLFCAGYYLVLRHLTFYTLNRAYLMVAIVFATLYPKIDLSDFALRHETIAKPVQTVILNWRTPAESLIKPLTHPDYWQWATVIFWAGAVFLGFRLLMQLFSLFILYRKSKPGRIHNHDVRLIDGEAAPFSFWRTIYVNPANHTPADLQAILLHEQVHVNGWHTADILLAELSSIFYWFNPGVWLMKKAVRENIEFITDRKILNKGFDSKAYQYSLVNVSFNTATPGIVNHFNISTIKKRIIMMNAKRSSKFKLTRYAFVVPAVVLLLLVFTLSKADVAKPVTHKIALTIKPFTVALKQVTKNPALVFRDTVPKKLRKTANSNLTATDTGKQKKLINFTIKLDTAKKQTLTLSNKADILDSTNLIVNGRTISSAEFRKIDPSNYSSVTLLSAAEAKKVLGNSYTFTNEHNNTALVITKSSNAANSVIQTPKNPNFSLTLNNSTVNRISDKLIVIDGKVASEKELKKLTAFDIDRMSTSNSADTVNKYGDKAKYGVVYIYTKKGKQ
jgi:bla regulator protein BlaR1